MEKDIDSAFEDIIMAEER